MFSDSQIQRVTQQLLALPNILGAQGNGLLAQRDAIQFNLKECEKNDAINQIIFDHILDKIFVYHDKFHKLVGVKKAMYDVEELKLAVWGEGRHFPQDWHSFYPKLTGDCRGLPVESPIGNELDEEAQNQIEEISEILGWIRQNDDGTFEGDGLYRDFFQILCLRISKGDGTLTKLEEAKKAAPFLCKKVADAKRMMTLYGKYFAFTQIVFDTEVGQREFQVYEVSGFSVNDSVKLMCNEGNIYNRIITEITGDVIKLDQGIPVVLSARSWARIVKVK